jgi:hypothetical protein
VPLGVEMGSGTTAGGQGPVVPSRPPRRRSARDEVLERLDRWKRAIAVAAVVAFGALIGLVGAVGARGSDSASTAPRASEPSDGGGQPAAPDRRGDDGFFGGGTDKGFGFGGSQPQAPPAGRSGAS